MGVLRVKQNFNLFFGPLICCVFECISVFMLMSCALALTTYKWSRRAGRRHFLFVSVCQNHIECCFFEIAGLWNKWLAIFPSLRLQQWSITWRRGSTTWPSTKFKLWIKFWPRWSPSTAVGISQRCRWEPKTWFAWWRIGWWSETSASKTYGSTVRAPATSWWETTA